MKNKALSIVKSFVTLLVVYSIASFAVENWNSINFKEINIDPVYLLLAALPFIAHIFLYAKIWKEILRTLNEKITYKTSSKIYANSEFWRYIPGRVMLLVRRVSLSKNYGIKTWVSTASMGIELIILLLSAAFVSALGIIYSSHIALPYKVLLSMTSAVLFIAALNPLLLKGILKIILKTIKIDEAKLNIKYDKIVWIAIAHSLVWILNGIGFYLIISTMHNISLSLLPTIISIFALSWIIGFLSFLAPGGVGAREGAAIILGSQFLPINVIIVASVLSRLFILFSETVFWTVVNFTQNHNQQNRR